MSKSLPKNHLDLDAQVSRLRERGLLIEDTSEVKRFLLETNYYRLSGYAREFQYDPRAGGNNFVPGTSFALLKKLVELDSKLRLLFVEALSIIEVQARSAFAYESGKLLGDRAFYLEENCYQSFTTDLDLHIGKIEKDLLRKNQPTVERYRDGDDLSGVPIWVAIEKLSFGSFVKTCAFLIDDQAAKNTAAALNLSAEGFSDTLHAFAALRNTCAHHGQLWNRSFDIAFKLRPKEKRVEPKHKSPGSYPAIVVIRRWLRALGHGDEWGERVTQVLNENEHFQQGILFPAMK